MTGRRQVVLGELNMGTRERARENGHRQMVVRRRYDVRSMFA